MKKRIPYLLMSMAMVFAFASCDAHAHTDLKPETSGEYSPTVHDKVESFNITESNVSLTVGATHQLKAHFQPIFQETPSISYTSNNPSVVAVDASGKLTAKSSGFAIITGNCGDFSSQCYVSVTPEDTLEKGTQNLKTIANAQGHSSYESPTYLKAMTASFSTLYQDGVVKTSSTNFETMYIDTEEAYVRMTDSYYAKTKTQGGVAEITLGEWIIYCTSSFETFLFHVEHGVKRYIKVDCAKYIESGDRWGAVCDVLDKLFLSGSAIFKNQLTTVGSQADTKDLIDILENDYSDVPIKDARGDEAGNAWIGYTIEFERKSVDFDVANNLDVPTGVDLTIKRAEDFYYTENYCRYFNSNNYMEYDWRGSHYVSDEKLGRTFELTKKPLYYPNIKTEGWSKGEDIFDI